MFKVIIYSMTLIATYAGQRDGAIIFRSRVRSFLYTGKA